MKRIIYEENNSEQIKMKGCLRELKIQNIYIEIQESLMTYKCVKYLNHSQKII